MTGRQTHLRTLFAGFSLAGIIGATIAFTWSLTPSLLPRTWMTQGLVSGIGSGLGYSIGWIAQRVWYTFLRDPVIRALRWWRHVEITVIRIPVTEERARANLAIVRRFFVVAFIAWVCFSHVMFLRWQAGVALSVGMPAPGVRDLLPAVPMTIGVFFGVVLCARVILLIVRAIAARFPHKFRFAYRMVTAMLVLLLFVGAVVEYVVPNTTMNIAERVFTPRNLMPNSRLEPPQNLERSGSPESYVSWEDVGYEGSKFLTGGASASELTELTGRPAKEPIRLYAGLRSGDTVGDEADLLVSELERTNAEDRHAILLVMSTGTGWVSSYSAQAFELLYGGDTATVSLQYSVVPSAIHFVQGGTQVAQAGRDFITPIVEWVHSLPAGHRPKIYLYGESLGTTGIEGAFSAVDFSTGELGVDGILFAGAPYFNHLRRLTSDHRDAGSTELHPVYDGGQVVRYANSEQEVRGLIGVGASEWGSERVLYMQNPSDPVAWWSPTMGVKKPQWISDASATRAMTWFPVVTNLQMLADMPGSKQVPQGYGHNYGTTVLYGFAAIAGNDLPSGVDVDELEDDLLTVNPQVF